MTILERARQYREQLRKGETEAAKALIGAFGTAHNRLQAQLAKVTEKVEAARSAGQEVSKAWLAQEKRYKELLQHIDAETKRLANLGTAVTTKAQSDAVKLATKQAADFAHAAIGTSWNRVPFEALEHLVGTLQDGSPLKELFDKLGENASAEIQDALKTALIQGKNPRDTAKVMREAFGGNLSRSLTVARTEQLRSYRQASLDNYRANDDVVQGWIRIETLDDLTCTVCIMEHGKEYPTDEDFDTHPNCRGTMIPKVEGKDYGIETGKEWLEKQPEDKQQEILGKSKYEAWKDNKITLDSLVEHTQSEKWGGGIRERTLAEAIDHTTKLDRSIEKSDHSVSGADERWFEYEHAAAIKDYQRGMDLNRYLTIEGNKLSRKEQGQVIADAETLQRAAHARNGEHEVWRGLVAPEGDLKKLYPQNGIVKTDSLTSTSPDKRIAKIYTSPDEFGGGEGQSLLLRLEDPKGIQGYRREDGGEILLPKGASYRITGRYEENGIQVVRLIRLKGDTLE